MHATDLSLLCVGTPSRRNGSLDLSYLERVCEQIGDALRDKAAYHVVVVRSTVLPGTTHEVVIPALERTLGQEVRQGLRRLGEPRVPARGHGARGLPQAAADARRPQLRRRRERRRRRCISKVEAPLITTSIRVAEMMKYTSNTWHALKVCFANEIGNLCKRLDVDSHEVMDIFCQDDKLNLSPYYLKPGFAFGGSCLPKDVRALQYRAKELDLDMPVLESILGSNRLQIEHAIDMVVHSGHKRVGLLGFSFKAGTDDLRESPIVILAEALLGKGYDAEDLRSQRLARAPGRRQQASTSSSRSRTCRRCSARRSTRSSTARTSSSSATPRRSSPRRSRGAGRTRR